MTGAAEMLFPALVLSGLAVACLALIPDAPPRIRFAIALGGLAVWTVPWPWLGSVALEITGPAAADTGLMRPIRNIASFTHEWADYFAGAARPVEREPTSLRWFIAALFLPGLVWFMADCLALHGSIRRWRRRSRSGEALRSLLPPDLRTTRAEIRIVEQSQVAAASGWLRPVIWVGDGFTDSQRRLALVHEAWHVRRCDPFWIVVIAAIHRAYWWNPVVTYLAKQAEVMMESACDDQCARTFGRRHYVEHLASMMLSVESSRSMRLVPNARSASLNVLRLRLLGRRMGMRARDYAVVGLMSAAGAIVAVSQVAAYPMQPAWSRVSIPATSAGNALTTLIDAFNNGDAERISVYLGAYTPQEVAWDLSDWAQGLELIDIVSSEPLSIEYIVKDNGSAARRIGTLEVAGGDAFRVKDSQLRDLPQREK